MALLRDVRGGKGLFEKGFEVGLPPVVVGGRRELAANQLTLKAGHVGGRNPDRA